MKKIIISEILENPTSIYLPFIRFYINAILFDLFHTYLFLFL